MHLSCECLSLDQLEKRLKTTRIGKANHANEVWQSIESTNTRVAALAAAGAAEGLFVAARQQTAGRGRLGRTWVSPPDAGIYISILLRPKVLSPQQLAPITIAAGVAVSKAVELTVGVKLGLKWVNDLVYEGRKVCGILAEMQSHTSSSSEHKKSVVLGIGLNLRLDAEDLPSELKNKIDWLERIAGVPLDPNEIAAQLLLEVERAYTLIEAGQTSQIIDDWRARSVTLGREIAATTGNTTIEGIAVDIDQTGALIVKTADGQLRTLHAGEITIRNISGEYT